MMTTDPVPHRSASPPKRRSVAPQLGLLCAWLAVNLTLVSCAGNAEDTDPRVEDWLVEFYDSAGPGETARLADATPFEWDTVHGISVLEPRTRVNELSGVEFFTKQLDSPVADPNAISMPRGEAIFFSLAGRPVGWTRLEPIIRFDEPGRPLTNDEAIVVRSGGTARIQAAE